jgi:hypothetical protein
MYVETYTAVEELKAELLIGMGASMAEGEVEGLLMTVLVMKRVDLPVAIQVVVCSSFLGLLLSVSTHLLPLWVHSRRSRTCGRLALTVMQSDEDRLNNLDGLGLGTEISQMGSRALDNRIICAELWHTGAAIETSKAGGARGSSSRLRITPKRRRNVGSCEGDGSYIGQFELCRYTCISGDLPTTTPSKALRLYIVVDESE